MKLLAIVNPHAASGKGVRHMPRLRYEASKSRHSYEWIITGSAVEMRSAIADAAHSGFDGVVLVGGDGTVAGALPALLEARLPLGLVPCGRGNDFARNVGLPLKIVTALSYPDRPETHGVDIPTANGVPFGSVACLGFDAQVNERAHSPNKYFTGRSVYIYAVLDTLRHFRSFDVSIVYDDHTWRGSIMMVAIANGCSYGGGMKIAPKADMQDGLLQICIVRETGKWAMMKEFPRIFNGRHTDHPNFVSFTARTAAITSESEHIVYADGEYVGRLPLTCAIGRNRLDILRPVVEE